MNDVIKTYWANAKFNNDLICIQTYSGYRMTQADSEGALHLLPPESSDFELGISLLDALSKSRFLLPEPRHDVWTHPEVIFDIEFHDPELMTRRYNQWIDMLKEKYGYKTKKNLLKNMKSCNAKLQLEKITFTPSHHEKLEVWSGKGIAEQDHVIISANSHPAEIGSSLRLAMSRCT